MTPIRLLVCVCTLLLALPHSDGSEPSPTELFNQRILPIFQSPNPSSCVQCHLSAVDLKNYILPSHDQTFVSLRDQELINLDEPRSSKILTLIQMGDKDLDVGAKLIHEETRNAEYEAFASWIEACCSDGRLRTLPKSDLEERAGPTVPNEVIRHARKSRVVDSFVRNIWSQRMRCFPCHTPFEIDEANARQQAAVKKHRELEEKYPELVDRMKIFRESPEETLQYLIDQSLRTPNGQLPLINLEDPSQSLFVLKPLSKLPAKESDGSLGPTSYRDPVTHLGGLKMHRNDQTFKSFTAWLQDYASVVRGRYTSVAELPADNWQPTKRILRLASVPAEWPAGTPVQLFVHARISDDGWAAEPVAFTQGVVTPRHMVNGALLMIDSSSESDPLPRGTYLVKVYVDLQGRIEADPTLMLGEQEFAGQVELKKARWREGFRHAEKVSGKHLSTD